MDNIDKLKDLITANHLDTYHRKHSLARLDAYIVVVVDTEVGIAYFNLKIMYLRRVNDVYIPSNIFYLFI